MSPAKSISDLEMSAVCMIEIASRPPSGSGVRTSRHPLSDGDAGAFGPGRCGDGSGGEGEVAASKQRNRAASSLMVRQCRTLLSPLDEGAAGWLAAMAENSVPPRIASTGQSKIVRTFRRRLMSTINLAPPDRRAQCFGMLISYITL